MNQKTIGKRIRGLREKEAWTQEHLAEAADVSVRTVQRAEEGTLSAETLTALAEALNIPVKQITEVSTQSQIPVVVPILFYEKLSTIEWLVRAFGFEITEKHTSPDGKILHAELLVGKGASIMCGSPAPKKGFYTPKKLKGVTQCLNIRVENVDAHFEKAKLAKVKILNAPENGYGHRRYQAQDPEGHQWYFATALEDAP